jgi:hypothetical protein
MVVSLQKIKTMTHKLHIDNGNELWFVANEETRAIDVFLFDTWKEARTRLATFGIEHKMPGGTWHSPVDRNAFSLFFKYSKMYPKSITKNINKCKDYLWNNGEERLDKTWNCFKRRVAIKVHKLTK